MQNTKNVPIKIRRISIRNYKGIDELEIAFPAPRMPGDPDILVMGSVNGLGKTSVMECCALLLLALKTKDKTFKLRNHYMDVDTTDLLIKAGAEEVEVRSDIVVGKKTDIAGEKNAAVHIRINRACVIKIKISDANIQDIFKESEARFPEMDEEEFSESFIDIVRGASENAITRHGILFFHSYRRGLRDNPDFGMFGDMIDSYDTISLLKATVIRAMIAQAGLFEINDKTSKETLEKLNELTQAYAGVKLGKLRASKENALELRVQPVGGNNTFSFDGLSAGQKEVISTLFLIWHNTLNSPRVVFIDEPELHLNPQWHRSFIKRLTSIAPNNQYIIATHSEDIMDSVYEDRRILLVNDR